VSAVAWELSTDAYRHHARRLRCRYAGQPALLQRSLKALALRSSAVDKCGSTAELAGHFCRSPVSAQSGDARLFARYVASSIPSGVLRYSQRLEFIRTARRFGVRRFEANLLIAAVLEQHRARGAEQVTEESPTDEGALMRGLSVFLVVQGALLFGTWWTLFR
jgi:hypothetical protein